MSLVLALLLLLGCAMAPAKGYYICPDDWQGQLVDCTYVDDEPPVSGVTVYYESGFGLKPYVQSAM